MVVHGLKKAELSLVLCALAGLCLHCAGGDPQDLNDAVTWEEFLSTTYQEPETGVFIVDGDTPIENEKKLVEFYGKFVAGEAPLIVHRNGQADARWSNDQKMNLTYCVSTAFGARHGEVVRAMQEAAAAWASSAAVGFRHVATEDANCNRNNPNVLFDVSPVNAGGQYLARAFFPGQGRASRNILIDASSFRPNGWGLVGILRHEVGHTLGFRHEHTRPQAGRCFEDNAYRELTPYDPASVMHYPQCNGTGNLELTATDRQGAAILYGPPTGATPTPPATPPPARDPSVTEFLEGPIARGEIKQFGPFAVAAGSKFTAAMTGAGDPDLYVRFGAAPTPAAYVCRPFSETASETCQLDVPAGATEAYVMVRGYTAGAFAVKVTLTPAATPTNPTPGATRTEVFNGALARGNAAAGSFDIRPGSVFRVKMTGAGDPDLYVRFGAEPTTAQFDCRPFLDGADEECVLTAGPRTTSAWVVVNALTDASYSVEVSYVVP